MSDREEGFERALAELESIVDSLESDGLELDEALQLFETGVERLRVAARLLDAAHGRVEELVENLAGELEVDVLGEAEEEGSEQDTG
jgi:exodeoxyribonuclease VII small subunit